MQPGDRPERAVRSGGAHPREYTARTTPLTRRAGRCSDLASLVDFRPDASSRPQAFSLGPQRRGRHRIRSARGAIHGNARGRCETRPASLSRGGRCGNRDRRGRRDSGDGRRPEGPHLPEGNEAQHPRMGELRPGLRRRVQAARVGVREAGRGRRHRRPDQHERPQSPDRLGHRDQVRARHHHDDLQLAAPLRRRPRRRGRRGRGDRQPGRRLLRAQQEGQRRRQPLEGGAALLGALDVGVPRGLVQGSRRREVPRDLGRAGARSGSSSRRRTDRWARPSATAWAIPTTGPTR